jgi:hypothetical protein
MPLLRYFTYVGGLLFALLFVASYVFPDEPRLPAHDAAKPVIRIASNRVVGPPRVDIDTSAQTAVAASVPALVAPKAPRAPAREAMAQVVPPQAAATVAPPAAAIKSEPKIEHKKVKIARRPDRRLVAAYPQPFQPFRWMW